MISDQVLHEQELAFFGKITASISHELNNVLSIINEYTGLLNDLCYAVQNGKALDPERIQQISINMAEQIRREQKLIKLLNRFAHRFDAPVLTFELSELVNDIYLVSLRFASMKKVTIEFPTIEDRISITGNPYRIQFVIFLCMQLALENSEINDTIRMNLHKEEEISTITIVSRDKDMIGGQEELMTLISSLITIVNGKIDYENNDEQFRMIKISLPLSV